jgi:plastocyanin
MVATAGCEHRVAAGPRPDAKAVEEIRAALKTAPKPAAAATETAEASGWANITGKMAVAGATPAPAALSQPKAVAECSTHPLVDESLMVKNGMLTGAVIFARTPKLQVNPDLKAPTEDIVLDNKNCRFEPHVVLLQAGQKLAVKNSDPFGHNTKIDSNETPAQNFSLPAGATVEHSFGKEEPQPVKVGCSIHPWMGGWIIVRGNPYGAVTGDDGAFQLAKLPAGREIEFQLWQEKAGFLSAATINGGAIKVDGKGRFKVKLEPDQDLALDISIPAESLK